jgi:HSP20 family protein
VTVAGIEEEDAMAKHDKTNPSDSTPAVRSSEWNDMVERWLGEWPRPRFLSELRRSLDDPRNVMNVEEFTEGDHLVVRAEMPGIDPDEDVHITVSDHTLHLQAERRQETKTEEHGTYRSEFSYGTFARTVALPIGASDEDVKATYKDGVLEVRIPVDRDEADAKRVPVQRV